MLAAPFFVAVQRVHADLWARVARSRRLRTWAVAFEKNGNVEVQWNFKCGVSFPGKNREETTNSTMESMWNLCGISVELQILISPPQNVKNKFS